MKLFFKIFVPILIAAVLACAGLITYIALTAPGGFTEEEYNNALEEGKKNAEKDRSELDDLILDLIKQIEAAGDNEALAALIEEMSTLVDGLKDQIEKLEGDREFDELKQQFDDLIADIDAQLEEQGAVYDEVVTANREALQSMYDGLCAMQSAYLEEITDLTEQFNLIDEMIEELEALEGDHGAEIATFTAIKTMLEKQAEALTNNLERLSDQIETLRDMLEALE